MKLYPSRAGWKKVLIRTRLENDTMNDSGDGGERSEGEGGDHIHKL